MCDPRVGWVGCVAAAAIAAGCGFASSKNPLSNRTEIARVEEPVLSGVDAPNATGIVFWCSRPRFPRRRRCRLFRGSGPSRKESLSLLSGMAPPQQTARTPDGAANVRASQ